MSNFKLALIEIYFPMKHGYLKNKNIYNHFLVIDLISLDEFYYDYENLKEDIKCISDNYKHYMSNDSFESIEIKKCHPTIRNYKNIVIDAKHFQVHIIDPKNIKHNNLEISTAIIKTHWIQLIQKSWRNYYKNKKRNMIKNTHHREIYGKFPKKCYNKFTLKI